MQINNWTDLKENCPVNLDRIYKHYKLFSSNLPSKITLQNLDKMKETLFIARGNLNSMLTSLMHLLYDKEIIKDASEQILFSWLTDNIGRYIKRLDKEEYDLIIRHDSANSDSIGISRISSYTTILQSSYDSLIYETLLKSTNEYLSIKEEDREKKKFLYIFFRIFQITMSIMGGLSREESTSKKGIVNSIPTTWQGLMTKPGQEVIKQGYKEDTGIDIDKIQENINKLNFSELEDDFDN